MPLSSTTKPCFFKSKKLFQYRSATYALTKLGAGQAHADIVMIDVSGSGFAINQPNAGLATGSSRTIVNFPTAGPALKLYNQMAASYLTIGMNGSGGLQFGITGGYHSMKKFSAGASIGSTSATFFIGSPLYTAFANNRGAGWNTVGNFGTSDYIGFRFPGSGSDFYYGWLQTTWDSATLTFQINSGAYQSTANTAILAGAAVPEPGTLTLGSLALLAGGGAAVRRYRKQRQGQTAPAPEDANPSPAI